MVLLLAQKVIWSGHPVIIHLLPCFQRRPGASLDDGAGPAGTMSGSAAAPGNRDVLVSSSISIRDYIMDSLPPYAPLEVPGPQAVAALNHLKRLGPQARARAPVRNGVKFSMKNRENGY